MLERDRGDADAGIVGVAMGGATSPVSGSASVRWPCRYSRKMRIDSPGTPLATISAVVEHDDPVADLAGQVGAVGDEQDGLALLLDLLDAVEALLLEDLVADRQHLVDEEDVGVDVDGDGEAEPHVHARRVVLHLLVDEVLELGEADDVVEVLLDLLAGDAEERGVDVDVLAAGEVGVEAGAELEQRRRCRPFWRTWPVVGLRMPAMHFSSVDLPEPLWPRMPTVSPSSTVRLMSSQGPEVLVRGAAELEHPLLDRVGAIGVQAELLRDVRRRRSRSSST